MLRISCLGLNLGNFLQCLRRRFLLHVFSEGRVHLTQNALPLFAQERSVAVAAAVIALPLLWGRTLGHAPRVGGMRG